MDLSDPRKFSSMLESEGEPLTSLNSEDLIFIHLDLHFQLCIRCHMPLPYSPCFLPPGAKQPLLPHVSVNMMLLSHLIQGNRASQLWTEARNQNKYFFFCCFLSIFYDSDRNLTNTIIQMTFYFLLEEIHILHTYLYKNNHRSGTARYKIYVYHPKLSKGRTSF